MNILSDNLLTGDTAGYSGDGQITYTNFINDGLEDMYDDGNILHTNRTIPYVNGRSYFPPTYVYSGIQYTHEKQIGDNIFTAYTGTEIVSGDTYFGSGSTYFTSLFDGFFLLAAHDINISEFSINGELGADGDGAVFATGFTTSLSGDSYSVFAKNVYDAGDPSFCHIIITDAEEDDVTQLYSTDTDFDNHCVRNITGATKLYFLIVAKSSDFVFSYSEIMDTANSFIQIQSGATLSELVSSLSANTSAITSNYSDYTSFSDEGREENITINFREEMEYPHSIAYSENGSVFGITSDSLYLINSGGTVTNIGGDFEDANSIALSGETLFMCTQNNSSSLLVVDKDTGLLLNSSALVLGNDIPDITDEAKIEELNALFMSNGELHLWAYVYLGEINSEFTYKNIIFKISEYNSIQNTLEYVGIITDNDIDDFVSIPTS